jgi:hypothetical protein
MPKYKVLRFNIKGDDVAAARKLKDFAWISFELSPESTSKLGVVNLIAARNDGSKIADVHYHGSGIFGNIHDDTELAQNFISRKYRITEDMFKAFETSQPGKKIKKLTFTANEKPYTHRKENEDPNPEPVNKPDPADRGKEFVQFNVDIDY